MTSPLMDSTQAEKVKRVLTVCVDGYSLNFPTEDGLGSIVFKFHGIEMTAVGNVEKITILDHFKNKLCPMLELDFVQGMDSCMKKKEL